MPPMPSTLAMKPIRIGTIWLSASSIRSTTAEMLPLAMSTTPSMTVLTNFMIRSALVTKNMTTS